MTGELVDRSALELGGMIARREVSCVEVVSAHLDRVNALEPSLHALVTRLPDDEVLAAALQKDGSLLAGEPTGWMHGLPHAVKDLADLRGLPTTLGLRDPAECAPATQDELFVSRIREAGAVFIGKTNTSELGVGSHSYNQIAPTTGNVHDPDRSAGGSSGGAAVAVASGLTPVADGSDFMGSLRNPPGWNGVLGMRPSPGVVLDRTDDPQNPGFGVNGPIARTSGDLRALLQTMAERGVDLGGRDGPRRESPTVAWLDGICDSLPFEPGVLDVCRRAAEAWTGGGRPRPHRGARLAGRLPPTDVLWQTWLAIRHDAVGGWVASAYSDDDIDRMKPEVQWEVDGFRRLTDPQRLAASEVVVALRSCVQQLFDEVDLLMLPTAQVWPFPSEQTWPRSINGVAMDTYHRWMEVTTFATLAGLPVVAVPAGRNAEGMHIGVQVIGRPGGDGELLSWVSWAEERGLFTVAGPTSVVRGRGGRTVTS